MAKSNRQTVFEGMELLPAALIPFVEKRLIMAFKGDWREQVIQKLPDWHPSKEGELIWDQATLLNIMDRFWLEAFKIELGRAERSIVNELLDVRNKLAHDETFSYNDAERALDSMRRLMEAINSGEVAEELGKMRDAILRTRFVEQQRNEERRKTPKQDAPAKLESGLLPWCEVIEPHHDVATGNFHQAEFAADLAKVHKGSAPSEYSDPQEFFSRTYLTNGLSALLLNAAKRLSGAGGDPVVELQTNFGGGKTHSILALYHLVGAVAAPDLRGPDRLLAEAGLAVPEKVSRAVLVGTARQPNEAFKPADGDGLEINTTWGELAWQLGGPEAYQMVASNDTKGVAPGSDLLEELFKQCAPCLILIDEWVAYLRSIYKVDGLPSGSFDTNLSFVQSLTEAVKAAPQTLLVATLPDSEIEVGGEGGQEALERLKQTFSRVQSSWRPASQEESYEIVRRRLFKELSGDNYRHRDNAVKQFLRMYKDNPNDFPQGCSEGDYQRKLENSYPIHPVLFDQLFEAWGSLETFQRTRGVLRLMAKVIHENWMVQDPSVMIMPGSVSISAEGVETELRHYLEDNWQSIIAGDIDGANSTPYRIDESAPNLNRHLATRRVARTIFMGTAPMLEHENRGLSDREINLGVMQPGDKASIFGDALRKLANQAKFMHTDHGRYWYSTSPSLNRIAADRASQLEEQVVALEIDKALTTYIKGIKEKGLFDAVQVVPGGSADVPDESEGVRLVVLGVAQAHSNGKEDSAALAEAAAMLLHRGSNARVFRNTLVFLAADGKQLESLEKATRLRLAWKEIVADTEAGRLDLKGSDAKLAQQQAKDTQDAMLSRLQEIWCWLIYPYQDTPQADVAFRTSRVAAQDSVLASASKKLVNDEALLPEIGPTRLDHELKKYIWNDKDHLHLKDLWEYFNRLIYLPRLKSHETLLKAVQGAVSGLTPGPFAYAELWEAEQGYAGLVIQNALDAKVIIDSESVIVRSETAQAAMQAQAALGDTTTAPPEPAEPITPPVSPPGTVPKKKFYGTSSLDPVTAKKEFAVLVDEVVEHFTSVSNIEVAISVEIQAAAADGFDPSLQRTVKENCNVLEFKNAEFEEGE